MVNIISFLVFNIGVYFCSKASKISID